MTLVESALVIAVFFLLLCGVFEYCRFLFFLQVAQNAARDASRYAVVNMDKPSTFDATDYTDASGTVFPSIQSYTTARMGGANRQLVGYRVAAYAVDSTGLTQTPPVVRPKSTNAPSYPDPFDAAAANRVPWNQASFTEGVAVSIDGTYTPFLPNLLMMPASFPLRITAIAGAEG
jgi:Flp pilus assembly protein TadG